MILSEKDITRFHAGYERGSPDACWTWQREFNQAGRARLWAGNAKRAASHVALHLDGRPRSDDAAALHSCDNPACVNPAHLRWGTQLENIAEREAKGRGGAPRGERSGRAKLTADQALSIRVDHRSIREIATDYGVRVQSIYNIKNGNSWSHV